MSDFCVCVLVPTYDNPETIREVVLRASAHAPVIVVDDGSGPAARAVIESLGRDGIATVYRRAYNGGKGAAVKDGLRLAAEGGYTHALQIDADGQHDTGDIPRFIEAARQDPAALVLGQPIFDASAPAARRWGRKITEFWTRLEVGGRIIADPLCGYRVYPVHAALASRPWGNAMDFDPEIAVRMVWNGTPVRNLPTRVRYLPRAEGGVSHFRMVRDNALISWMHTRMVLTGLARFARRLVRPHHRLLP